MFGPGLLDGSFSVFRPCPDLPHDPWVTKYVFHTALVHRSCILGYGACFGPIWLLSDPSVMSDLPSVMSDLPSVMSVMSVMSHES